MDKRSERIEALMRIVVAFVSGIILWVWLYVVNLFILFNFLWTLITGRRNRDLAELSEVWNTQKYRFFAYISGLTNERPFPFNSLRKSISPYSR